MPRYSSNLNAIVPLLLTSVVCFSSRAFASPTSEIQKNLRDYVSALNSAHPAAQARPFVLGAKPNAKAWERYWLGERNRASARSSSSPRGIELEAVSVNMRGQDAQATVEFFWYTIARQETLRMRRAPSGTWQIMPGTSPSIIMSPIRPLEQAAYFLTQGAKAQSLLNAKLQMRNLKNLTLNLYLGDSDSNPVMSLKSLAAAQSKPHGKGRYMATLRIEGTHDTYSFNTRLDRKRLNSVSVPSRTVLLYDGQLRQLRPRYNGQGLAAFVDGHIELLTPSQFKSKLW